MIYITADRFFGVLLNIRYPIYWNIKKTKLLLLGNATVTVGVIIALSIKYTIQPFFFCRFFTLYVQAALNFAVLFLFIITYTFIFHRYSRSGRVYHSSRETQIRLRKKLRTSKFYLYFLLMVSFILLCVVPNMYFWFAVGRGLMNNLLSPKDTMLTLYQVSFLIDSFIYIFLNPLVRRELRNVVQRCCC